MRPYSGAAAGSESGVGSKGFPGGRAIRVWKSRTLHRVSGLDVWARLLHHAQICRFRRRNLYSQEGVANVSASTLAVWADNWMTAEMNVHALARTNRNAPQGGLTMTETPHAVVHRSEQQALVSYHKIAKSYDGRTFAIRDFDLDIRQGEFLTMLGPSGSGKTTLLMMLAGFEAPTAGEIVVRGRQIQNIPAHRRNIGMVFQNYALFPHLTVAENVAYPLKVRGVSRSEMGPRVQHALATVHLDGYGDRRTTQLSGGQQQRVALARALVFNPDLVLMDEPFGALDKMLREEMQYEIKKLHSKLGVTIVFVTHDQAEALVMSDRVAILNHGKLQQVASPKSLYEDPTNSFVATFIGENNKLPGTLKVLSEKDCVITLASGAPIVCRRGDVDEIGQAAIAMVRPERVQVSDANSQAGDQVNSIPATITDITYLGEAFRLEMRLGCGTGMLAKLPNTKRAESFSQGQAVTLTWGTAEGTAFRPGDGV